MSDDGSPDDVDGGSREMWRINPDAEGSDRYIAPEGETVDDLEEPEWSSPMDVDTDEVSRINPENVGGKRESTDETPTPETDKSRSTDLVIEDELYIHGCTCLEQGRILREVGSEDGSLWAIRHTMMAPEGRIYLVGLTETSPERAEFETRYGHLRTDESRRRWVHWPSKGGKYLPL